LVVHEFEEEHLLSLFSILNPMNKVDLAGEMDFVSGPQIVGKKDPLFFSLSKVRSQVFQYKISQIRARRLTCGVLCGIMQTVSSDPEVSYAFVSFVKFSYVAMDAKNDPTLADCMDRCSSCVVVLTDPFISCLYLIKVLSTVVSCSKF
jgi:hypothetical protein